MKKPKTVKSFLLMLLAIAETDRDELRGAYKLTEEEWMALGSARAGVQNDLGEELSAVLDRYGLKYEG